MCFDHSGTYKIKSLKNLPHRLRLKAILSLLDNYKPASDSSYADFGCSNGYITDIIARRHSIERAHGFDYEQGHMDLARERYPKVEFNTVNLNIPESSGNFDLVTCFETLEHVGALRNALSHLIMSTEKDGLLFISVPIEIGLKGLIKFIAKSTIYRRRYQHELKELSQDNIWINYFCALLLNTDISRFREKRQRWGTHFGFDYREIDRFLRESNLQYKALNRFTTRFYFIQT